MPPSAALEFATNSLPAEIRHQLLAHLPSLPRGKARGRLTLELQARGAEGISRHWWMQCETEKPAYRLVVQNAHKPSLAPFHLQTGNPKFDSVIT